MLMLHFPLLLCGEYAEISIHRGPHSLYFSWRSASSSSDHGWSSYLAFVGAPLHNDFHRDLIECGVLVLRYFEISYHYFFQEYYSLLLWLSRENKRVLEKLCKIPLNPVSTFMDSDSSPLCEVHNFRSFSHFLLNIVFNS